VDGGIHGRDPLEMGFGEFPGGHLTPAQLRAPLGDPHPPIDPAGATLSARARSTAGAPRLYSPAAGNAVSRGSSEIGRLGERFAPLGAQQLVLDGGRRFGAEIGQKRFQGRFEGGTSHEWTEPVHRIR
jgi:hypothetical protein